MLAVCAKSTIVCCLQVVVLIAFASAGAPVLLVHAPALLQAIGQRIQKSR